MILEKKKLNSLMVCFSESLGIRDVVRIMYVHVCIDVSDRLATHTYKKEDPPSSFYPRPKLTLGGLVHCYRLYVNKSLLYVGHASLWGYDDGSPRTCWRRVGVYTSYIYMWKKVYICFFEIRCMCCPFLPFLRKIKKNLTVKEI